MDRQTPLSQGLLDTNNLVPFPNIRYMQKQHSSSLENAARHHLGSKAVLNINTARDGGILMTFRSPDLEKDLMNCPALDTL